MAPIELWARTIHPTGALRVLGVWLDPALRWKGNLDAVAEKMKSQLQALTCLSASTWGLPLIQGGRLSRELQAQLESQWRSQPARWRELHPRSP